VDDLSKERVKVLRQRADKSEPISASVRCGYAHVPRNRRKDVSIFLKIFLSSWIATIVVASILVGLIGIPDHRMTPVTLALPKLQACVVKTLQATLTSTPSVQAAAPCGLVYLLDSSGTARLGAGVSADLRSLAAGVNPESPVRLRPFRDTMMVAFDTPVDHAHFVAVAMLSDKHGAPNPVLPWPFLIAVAISTLTSLALTRHLVGPIRSLQLSTDSFGRGNPGARPASSLLQRNDEFGDLSKTIGQMSARISRLLSSQRNQLIQVSHELGSPLRRLDAALALARSKATPTLLPELEGIQRESAELNAMVQRLVHLAPAESSLGGEGRELFSLHCLMVQLCSDNEVIANEAGKQLHLRLSLQIELSGYQELLRRALEIVLRDAIRFTPEGSTVEVDVVRARDADRVLIQVRARGAGVQDDNLETIFEPFVRGASDRSGARTGLGMAKRAVEANGGSIKAFNMKEGGLLIEISLPCARINELTPGQHATAEDRGCPE
jgi:signal transduction histidine kinase